MRKGFLIFFLLFSIGLTSCEREEVNPTIPFTIVNEDINITNIQYLNLNNPGGYVYFNAGYRGLIIYNEGGGAYRVFERACTFDPRSECEPIVVDASGLFMKHECCKSTFNFNGTPTGGPAFRNLLEYRTFLDGIFLKITSD